MSNVTLKTIGQEIGVTNSTVSRVLRNDKTCYISKAKKDAILSCARRLNYSPNSAARNLVLGKTSNVAFVLDSYFNLEVSGPFLFQSIIGMQEEFENSGYNFSLITINTRELSELQRIFSATKKYDGLIFGRSNINKDAAKIIRTSTMPAVILDDNSPHLRDIPKVILDKSTGFSSLISHLRKLGHKKFLFYGLGSHLEIFEQIFKKLKLKWNQRNVFTFDPVNIYNLSLKAYRAADDLIDNINNGTAVCCVNDLIAEGLCQRLQDENIRVGKDVSVAGFDNIAEVLHIPENERFVTTVHNPRYEMGGEVAKLLLDILRKNKVKTTDRVLPCQLIIRKSTGPVK